ncbi:cell envelope integrity protein CreD [Capnocytophaga sp. Marseille-Q4570]|uniref:Cell envelope integrity protein CreD n=1 Tax=Capnocytophaga bilenii TaxID=2819369 RepID=A0ABS3PY05_9FLAO|nr:cell envelope integrity protein CreD [Capnocytophaga bilenii]MBO1884221.1 cell envelope integrity protein CreD [Capnocytophaga bilenii]
MDTDKTTNNLFQSNTFRLILIGLLTLVLLIPLLFVQNLVSERKERQESVVNEIANKWGGEVFFYGPILKIPYKVYDNNTFEIRYAYFFPEVLKNTSNVKTETKKRNNYETVVFNATMDFSGNYIAPDFSTKGIANEHIEWNKATILIRTTNLASIKNGVTIKLGGKDYPFEPIYEQRNNDERYYDDNNDDVASLETGFINFQEFLANPSFEFSIQYDGSKKIAIVPIGKTTESTLSSNWANPSFMGNFLPYDKQINANGFTASWRVLHINRPFAQQSFGTLPSIAPYTYDVDFIIPVDEYQQNERVAKYGYLVIFLTFLIFFLIQSISKIKIHIFQYTMIGLALVLFYTLLISITEHSSFSFAYFISSLMTVGLISLYSISILKNKKFPTFIFASLAALYGFIYVIIQLENYALLVGSIGLFAILATVMYVSRKVEWSAQ